MSARDFDEFCVHWEERVTNDPQDPRRRPRVLDEIAAECRRQDAKWGKQDHSPIDWFAILGEEFGEVGKEVTKWLPPRDRPPDATNYRVELIQMAAVAARMLESFDRQLRQRSRG